MSFESAFSGDTYKTCTSSERPLDSPSSTKSLIAERKAASVLPEPVGAAIRALRCWEVTAQARFCASVGAGKRLLNHPATAGWKPERASGDIVELWHAGVAHRMSPRHSDQPDLDPARPNRRHRIGCRRAIRDQEMHLLDRRDH